MTNARGRRIGRYAVLACALGFAAYCTPADDRNITWLGNYREALRQAKESRKPLFVEFRCEA
jgi:hypothetical protein